VSIFIIGALYWASIALFGVVVALVATAAIGSAKDSRSALGKFWSDLHDRFGHARAVLQEPLPSSPSSTSFPRP
jgi:hypothetical protein